MAQESVEHLRWVLERIRELEPATNAFIAVFEADPMEEARRAEREITAGHGRGPLHGVRVSVKDVFDIAGHPTTAASAATSQARAQVDAVVVRPLRDAGAVVLGKANCFELAMAPRGDGAFGSTANPWDHRRTTPGSSSSGAAAVALGLGSGSIGLDTRGSVRGPAEACGVTGFKPSSGLISTRGMLPLSQSLDHVGVLARDARDCGPRCRPGLISVTF